MPGGVVASVSNSCDLGFMRLGGGAFSAGSGTSFFDFVDEFVTAAFAFWRILANRIQLPPLLRRRSYIIARIFCYRRIALSPVAASLMPLCAALVCFGPLVFNRTSLPGFPVGSCYFRWHLF